MTNANVSGSGIIDGGEGTDTIKFGTLGAASFVPQRLKTLNLLSSTWETGTTTVIIKRLGSNDAEGCSLSIDSHHATFANFVMEGGEIYASLASKDAAPLITDSFD